MDIRPATAADAEGMSAVLATIIAAGGPDRPSDPDHVRGSYITHPDQIQCSVAEQDGRILGFQSLRRATADNPYGVAVGWGIIGTHIGSDAARTGVGRALFQVSLAAAHEAGIGQIDATIGADNAPGLAYYDAMGFRTYRHMTNRICKVYALDPASGHQPASR